MDNNLKIVIVNWNSRDDTIACLSSLFRASAKPEQIILVDNGSEDGSLQAIEELYGNSIKVIANPTNLNFAPASNQGFRYALEASADWILWLNNDTEVADNFFAELQKALIENPSATILSPLIFYHSERERIWYLGDYLVGNTLITHNHYQGKQYNSDLAKLVPVDFVSGCAMLIKREVFEKVGLLDSDLQMYGEEVDFIWRARLAGYRPVCMTRVHMWHKVSASANRDRPRTRYFRVRNQIRFYRKYSKGFQQLVMFVFSIYRAFRYLLKDISSGASGLPSATFRGWWDGWRGI